MTQNLIKQDPGQIAQDVYDISNNAIRTTNFNSLVKYPYDYISVAYPNTTTEVYTFKNGGATGTTVAIVTVAYVDLTKEQLSTVSVV